MPDRTLRNSIRYTLLLCRNLAAVTQSVKVTIQPIPLAPIIQDVLELQESLLSDCAIEHAVEPNLPSVLADELSLLQILVNLTTNATEAMQGEGRLSTKGRAADASVEVIVTDTGTGILPENLERIFDLSFSTKDGHERGVGLYVVSSIMKKLDGAITVVSEPGVGSTFTLKFPAYMGEGLLND